MHASIFYFLIEIFIEVSIDLPDAASNNIRRSCVCITQFFPMFILLKTMLKYYNQDINIDARKSSEVGFLYCLFPSVCVCVCVFYLFAHMCRFYTLPTTAVIKNDIKQAHYHESLFF